MAFKGLAGLLCVHVKRDLFTNHGPTSKSSMAQPGHGGGVKGKERRETPPQRNGGAEAEEPPLRAVSQRSGGAGAEEPCAAQNPKETAKPLVRGRPQPLPGVSRLRVLLLYVLLVLLGVPVWWKATEVYRAAIPFHLLDQVVCSCVYTILTALPLAWVWCSFFGVVARRLAVVAG